MNESNILHELSNLWHSRQANLPQYFKATYGYVEPDMPLQSTLIIIRTNDGSVENDEIGSTFEVLWALDGGIIVRLPADYARRGLYKTTECGAFYITPSYQFYFNECGILLSERYGPHLRQRQRGSFLFTLNGATIIWKNLWASKFSY